MTKQEKWDLIVNKIDLLEQELQELVDDSISNSEDIESALLGLRLSIDELSEQELE